MEDLPLEPWLQTVWKAERAILDRRTCRLGAELGLAELLLSGVTTVMDMFWFPEATVAAAAALGMRVATGGIFFDYPGMDGGRSADRRAAEAFFAMTGRDEAVIAGVHAHGTYTVGPDHLVKTGAIARRHAGFFCTHAAEAAAEQATVVERYGRRVIEHLAALELLGPRTVLAHCVHLSEASGPCSPRPARTSSTTPCQPQAGLRFRAHRRAGGGRRQCHARHRWRHLRQRSRHVAGHAPRYHAAQGGAGRRRRAVDAPDPGHGDDRRRALGVEDRLGSIEVGKAADFLLLAIDRLHAVPLFDPITHRLFVQPLGCRNVFVARRQLVTDGRLVTADVAALVAAVRGLGPRIRLHRLSGLGDSPATRPQGCERSRAEILTMSCLYWRCIAAQIQSSCVTE